ncbi:serine/threonine protein kinase [Nonomuraea sp. K274]|uniref:Serine/threonine protein kinase n=1 Tax=Nonomuraea cypriaca TaxID=1187855 RepID=A0A931AN88_9ACTN|nr:serine/threonine-protein kinase [Nonomuraea cypriaca]MBF8192002.1 serine/threonine protein kinase [Nonomuraea cypriaca]
MRPLTVGDPVIIGRYLLLGRLGTGGMGVVYLAEHPQGGLVALKTPHAVHLNDATLRARFAEEVAFSRRLVPFCTAAVIEDGTDEDRPYLVTEYIPGPALSQVVRARGPLTPDLAYGVALGVAAALVAVHEAGLVHRDLKPGNVLLSPRGPRVIDFGIARDVDTLGAHTQAGQVMGSPGWVAPERLTGGTAMPASDVFAWGCLVAFAASGHHPFGGGEHDALTRRILFEPPRLEGVPALLRPAVEAALAKEPIDRPKAADLLRVLLGAGGVGDPWDLRQAVSGVLAAIWSPVPYPPGGGRVRHASTPGWENSAPGPPYAAAETTNAPATAARGAGPDGDGQGAEPGGAARGPGFGGDECGAGSGSDDSVAGPADDGWGGDDGQGADAGGDYGGRRGSRAKAGAHLSHATFAALATVSIAAITVIAAAGGDGMRSGGGSELPGNPPAVQFQGSAGSTVRPRATSTGGLPPTRVATAAPAKATPTIFITPTRTMGPPSVLSPSPAHRVTHRPAGTAGPSNTGRASNTAAPGDPGGPDPGECANPAGRRRGDAVRRDCPRPSGSITTIPQDGPGESPGTSPSISETPTATATSTGTTS